MKIFTTAPFYAILVIVLLSCSFSTTNSSHTKSAKQTPIIKQAKLDTSKFIAVKKPTPQETAKRDSLLKVYIGGIVKPYFDDIKLSNNKNTNSLLDIIKYQSIRLDSLGNQRLIEARKFESNSISRDSATQALIKSNKSNDSLKTLIINLDQRYTEFTSSLTEIFNNIKLFATIMGVIMVTFLLIIFGLNIAIFLKKKNTNTLKYNV